MLGTCAPKGQGTLEEPVYCLPPQPTACASLGTKQSLLSNFKCYLRTAWPQPKTALWKLAFRCRGCKYQRHTFGGGRLLDASPLSAAGAGPERTHRHTEAGSNRGTHTSCCGLHTRRTTAMDPSIYPNIHSTRIGTPGEGRSWGCCPWPVGFGIVPAGKVSEPGDLYSLVSQERVGAPKAPLPLPALVSPVVEGSGGPDLCTK